MGCSFDESRHHIPTLSLRRFAHDRDATWLHGLWHRALNPRWSLSMEELVVRLRAAAICVVAEDSSGTVAFSALSRPTAETAGLLTPLVEP